GRKPWKGNIHFVLSLNRRDIGVRAKFESDQNGDGAVVRATRKEVQHTIEARELLLDRLRDRFFQIQTIAAQVSRSDLHHGRNYFRKAGDGKIRDRDAT